MRRVAADTNVLVSAIQFGGKPKQLIDLAADGHIDLATSEAIRRNPSSAAAHFPVRWQAHTRRAIASTGKLAAANRPRYLFSGLTKCGVCGAGFILGSVNCLSCFGARDPGHVLEPPDHSPRRGWKLAC